MIEFKNYWYYRLVLYFIFFGGIFLELTSLVLIIIMKPQMTLDSWSFFLFVEGILLVVLLFLWSFHSKLIIRAEYEEGQYRLTSATCKRYLLDPTNVKFIKHGERFHSMTLTDDKVLYFERRLTLRGFLSTRYYDPWNIFLTQHRFPNAKIK